MTTRSTTSRSRSLGIVIGLLVFVGGGLAWLAWDDGAFEHPLTVEQLAPAPPRAQESYALTLAFNDAPEPAKRTIPAAVFTPAAAPEDNLDAWRAEIAAHREEIARDWEQLADVRQWFDELDQFDGIGDVRRATDPVMRTAVLTRISTAASAYAGVLALDGKGDEAFVALRPIASVLMKLERNARSETRLLAAATSLTRVLAAAQFVAATAPPSPATREPFRAAIAERDVKDTTHRLAWFSYAAAYEALTGPDAPRAMFTVLPKRTMNTLLPLARASEQRLADPGNAAAAAEIDAILKQTMSFHIKNSGGMSLLSVAMPNMSDWSRRISESEKRRTAVLAALAA